MKHKIEDNMIKCLRTGGEFHRVLLNLTPFKDAFCPCCCESLEELENEEEE